MTKQSGGTSVVTPVLLAAILGVLAYGQFFDRPQYEYMTRFVGDSEQDDSRKLEEILDAFGADGWELVSFKTEQYANDWTPTTARVALRRRRP